MKLTEAELRCWLIDQGGLEADELDMDTRLFTEDRLDSLLLVELLALVEQASGRKVAWHQVNLENFDTMRRILEFAADEDA